MKKVKVWGKAEVYVYQIVEVEDNAKFEDAVDAACNELRSLTTYCGNGGTDKLCGVYGSDCGLDGDMEIEWGTNGEEDIEDINKQS